MESKSTKTKVANIFSANNLILAIAYSFVSLISIVLSFALVCNFKDEKVAEYLTIQAFLAIIALKLAPLIAFKQFNTLLGYFHIQDLVKIFWALSVTSVIFVFINLCYSGEKFFLPYNVIAVDYVISLSLISIFRVSFRALIESLKIEKKEINVRQRVAIIGAGEVGTAVAANFLTHKSFGVLPSVFLDEDSSKIGKEILGLDVLPLSCDFSDLAKKYSIDRAIIAISRLPKAKIGDITLRFSKLGIETSIVPSYYELSMGLAKVSNLREVSISDILGRETVSLSSPEVDAMVKDKVVMITGAGGSIGSELCKQVAMKNPSLLVMIDHCEVQLFKVEQDIIHSEYGVQIKSLVGNVADEARMDFIVSKYKPNLILHAAAHKHVPMMESQPSEALKNNTLGTWNLAEIASKYEVEKFLLISTDKAINPTNVMGASKRLAEKVIQAFQNKPENKTQFFAVRFGNVLGSSGSVIPTFKRQIAEGGPLTVTHLEVTRYFMTIQEAVGLVLQCATQASGGEIFVLDMGEPVKIIDLARQMIRLSGFEPDIDIKIKVIGLRPGEKLYEEIQHKNESLEKTDNPRIFGFVSKMPSYEDMKLVIDEIKNVVDTKSTNELKLFIKSKVSEYTPQFYE